MMHNALKIMLFAALAALPSHAGAAETAKGDVNGDGKVDMEDVALLRDVALGLQPTSLPMGVTDINGDGVLTVTDVTRLRNDRRVALMWTSTVGKIATKTTAA